MSETTPPGLSDNAAGAIAYITFIPAIVFLVMPPYNSSPYVRFHAWQSIFLNIAAFIVDVSLSFILTFTVTALPFGSFFIGRSIWLLVELAWFLVWIICLLQAVNGKRFKLPILGDLAEKQAMR
jgi:uncharacterized membrane protein